MKRSILDVVHRERGRYSNNQLAKNLGIDKRELLKAYKILDREGQSYATESFFQQNRFAKRFGSFFRSPLRTAVAIFLVGLLWRLAIIAALYRDPLVTLPILDADYYSQWAQKIISGEAYPSGAFFTEPGYAYVVALFYKVFGIRSLPVILFQIILGSLSPVLLFLAVVRLTKNRLAGSIVGFAAALFGAAVFYDMLLLKTSLEFFLVSLIIWAVAYFWEPLTWRRALFLGGLFGITALIKANILFALPLLLIFFILSSRPVFTQEKIFSAGAFLLGVCLMIAPATIRNFEMSHAFILINSSGGANLYIGNWEGADGTLKPPEYISTVPAEEENDWRRVAESYAKRQLNPAEVSAFWTQRAVGEIIRHPLAFVGNTFWKTFLLLDARTLGDDYNRDYAAAQTFLLSMTVPDFLVLAIGFWGMLLVLATRDARRKYAPFLIIAFVYSATIVISHVADRYRMALFPFFFLFGGYVVVWLAEQVYERDIKKIFIAFLVVAGFSSVMLLPPPGISGTTVSDMLVNFGGKLEERGADEEAQAMYERSFEENNKHIPTLAKLAHGELLGGNFPRALELYRQALLIQPEFPADELYVALDAEEKHLAMDAVRARLDGLAAQKNNATEKYDINSIEGTALIRKQDYEKALPFFEAAAKDYPESLSVLSNLATAYKNTQKTDKAVLVFQRLLEAHPEALQARFNYANLLSEQKTMLPAAIAQYEEINRAVPGYYISRYYLGLTYAEAGQGVKAIETLQKFVDEAGGDPAKQGLVSKAEDALKRLKGL